MVVILKFSILLLFLKGIDNKALDAANAQSSASSVEEEVRKRK